MHKRAVMVAFFINFVTMWQGNVLFSSFNVLLTGLLKSKSETWKGVK